MTPKLVAQTETDADDENFVSEGMRHMSPAERADYLAAIDEGRADIAAGRWVSAEKVRAWIDTLGTDHELPLPECEK